MAATYEQMGQRTEQMSDRGREMMDRGHEAVEQGASWVPAELLLMGAGASILGSLALKASGRDEDALFVGQWAPTLVGLAIFTRIVQRLGAR